MVYTGVLWKTKLKEIPPNIKIITHYKQITILNVIFVIMGAAQVVYALTCL